MDYCRLNTATHKDSYLLPYTDGALDYISGSLWLSYLDLSLKTAFSIGQGLWLFMVMPFGFYKALATFKPLMEKILPDIPQNCCVVYLDDLLAHATVFPGALQKLKVLQPPGYTSTPKSATCFAGLVSGEGVSTDPARVTAVREWPTPNDVVELCSFLGLARVH